MRIDRDAILPSFKAAAQYRTSWATDAERHGARPPEVIMATFMCCDDMLREREELRCALDFELDP